MTARAVEPDLAAVRARIEARERDLSPHAVRSFACRGRAAPEPPPDVRSEFQRDRDRIVHAKAFRRLKHKSQVFVAPRGDHFTTRLTHVIEVSQVGRTIARALNLNEDLVEAIALGHDLGHTPFGHIGEAVLDQVLEGGFHHSRHSVRIVEKLEKDGRGLNLTQEVILGIRDHSKPQGEFMSADAVVHMTLEAQIVRISDVLAYLAHDINDALRAGYLTLDQFPADAIGRLGRRHSQRVNTLVTDVVSASWDCTGEIEPQADRPWIRMSDDVATHTTSLRDFMFERFYMPISRSVEGLKAAEIVRVLLDHFRHQPDAVPRWLRDISGSDAQAAADYVCGMTDNYALSVAERVRPGLSEGVFAGRI